jgi:hypothetical protein
MADKVITIAGQRVKVLPFSDYYIEIIKLLYHDGEFAFDLKRHSDLIAMAVEIAAPTLPKHFFKKVGESYRWIASMEAFAELVAGLWLCYWEWELESAKQGNDTDRIEMAQMQIGMVKAAIAPVAEELQDEEPDPTAEELQAEIAVLRAQMAATPTA